MISKGEKTINSSLRKVEVKNFSPPENALFLQVPEPISDEDSHVGRWWRRHGKNKCMAGLTGLAGGGFFWVSGAQSCAFIACEAHSVPSNQGNASLKPGHLSAAAGPSGSRALQEHCFSPLPPKSTSSPILAQMSSLNNQ